MSNRTLKDLLYEQLARVGKALASPKRLEMLEMPAQGEYDAVHRPYARSLPLPELRTRAEIT